MVLVRADDLEAVMAAAFYTSGVFKQTCGYAADAEKRLSDTLSSPQPERVLMGYVLRERGGDRAWIHVDGYGAQSRRRRPCMDGRHWNDPVEAQEYADRFCNDVEVLPVYVNTEG